MPRAKKDYKNISLKMDTKIHAMLVAYADDKGQSLTTAVERILKEKLESEGYKAPAESVEKASKS